LRAAGGCIVGVETRSPDGRTATLDADAYVVALGSYSRQLLASVGISIPVYPAKGYSITVPVADPCAAPSVSLTDDAHKLVFTRLGDELRVAGTAELNGYDTSVNALRCAAIAARAQALLPHACDYSRARPWAGLRPATPGNVPLIGRSRLSNLFLNTGHGTLGWTHACGSGMAIADLVSNRAPEVDFRFVGAPRRPAAIAGPRERAA
jgi:D-amino-acid dehydrogenase